MIKVYIASPYTKGDIAVNVKRQIDMYDELVNEVIKWSEIANPNDIDKWLDYCKIYLENYEWNSRAIKDFLEWGENMVIIIID